MLESFSETDFIRMKKEELAKLRELEIKGDFETTEEYEIPSEDENLANFSIKSLGNFAKKIKERHFQNEINTSENISYEEHIEVEKELDDEGGLEIEL